MTNANPFGSPRATWLAAAIISLSALAVYANSFNGEFVFDDIPWIQIDPSVHKLWPLTDVLFPSNKNLASGRPVLNLTLAVNYVLGGNDPGGYHVVNMAIHILAGLTLFGVVRRTLTMPPLRARFAAAATPLALAIALVWIVHPLQTAAVTYVIQRTEALMGLFYLLTLYCVIRGAGSIHWLRWYSAAVVACLLGMGTKEVMATAPVVVLLYDRAFLSGSFAEALRRRWGLYLAMAATWSVVAWCLVSTGFHTGSTGFGAGGFSAGSYALTQPGVIVHYLQLAFWPAGMSLDYGWPAAESVGAILPPALVVATLVGLTIWGIVKNSPWGFLGTWFFAILAPTSSFVPIRDAAFDHRMYLPLAAVVTLVIVGGYVVWDRLTPSRLDGDRDARRWLAPTGLLSIAVVALGWATIQRNEMFCSAADVWRDVLEKNPDRERAHNNLAAILVEEGQIEESMKHSRRALELTPGYADAENNLGHALTLQGKTDEAIPYFEASLRHYPDHPRPLQNLGKVRFERNEIAAATDLYRRLLDVEPWNAEAHYFFANCLRDGDPNEAIKHFKRAIEINPDYAEAHNNLASVLAKQGKDDEAVVHFQRTLDLTPDHAGAHHNLGSLLYRQGKTVEAERHWREAVRLKPKEIEYLSNLALVLATRPEASQRNGAEAVELAQRAMELSKSKPDPNLFAILPAAYAEVGDFSKAVAAARQARELALALHQAELAEQLIDRIKLYESGKPLRM